MRCVGVSSMMPGLAPLASSNLLGHHECLELLQCGNANRAVYVDLDDTVGRWHLQDQVPIVGDSHELAQGRLTNDGIEWEVDLHNVEEDALCAVVLKHLKGDREGDATA
jgi:hypothetical protein